MTATSEEVILSLVQDGVLHIDVDGVIWRLKRPLHYRDGTKLVPCRRVRAERRTTLGYLQVSVMINKVRYLAAAHRIVYRAKVGPIAPGLTINHLNGRKDDNRPVNLELATHSEQALHARYVLGRQINLRGEEHPNSKLTSVQVMEIRARRAAGEELKAIAGDFGIVMQTVSKIARRQAWVAQARTA